MPRLGTSPLERTGRKVQHWLTGGVLVVALLLLLRALLMPDPAAALFARAERLEANGLWEQALRHYELLTKTQPDSSYAPRALQRQGVILTGMARRSGDETQFRQAITVYEKLADDYPEDVLAGEALLAAGEIAINDLTDARAGAALYNTVLERYANNKEYSSEATLRLGRIALMESDGKKAQTLFQRVLQSYDRFQERCAEAQYHLGVVYETLFKKKEWAQDAYSATIAKYPTSIWANNAKERLGLLAFYDIRHRPKLRRVEIVTKPQPANNMAAGSTLAALLPLLAARGLEVNEGVLRGWSLEPFYAGFDPDNPSRPVQSPLDAFDTIVANAGLEYSPLSSANKDKALARLQEEVDYARPPVIYNGQWSLVVGYDTQKDEVMLQNAGARVQTVAVKELVTQWQQPAPSGAPGGGPWTMLQFFTPRERPQLVKGPKERLVITTNRPTESEGAATRTPTPVPTPVPSFAAPVLGATPLVVYELKPLLARDAHRRTLKRARDLMRGTHAGKTLLNIEALDGLARELERVAAAPPTRPAPNRNQSARDEPAPRDEDGGLARDAARSPLPVPEGEATPAVDNENSPPANTVSPEAPSESETSLVTAEMQREATRRMERAQALRGWFNTPLQSWINARSDAAIYLDLAAGPLGASSLRRASDEFEGSISALKRATALWPLMLSEDGRTLSDTARTALQAVAREIRAARDAEKRALAAMDQAG